MPVCIKISTPSFDTVSMKYELETIPIWDAYKTNPLCPLCVLEKKAEGSYVKFFLGSSVMNPETRIQVNDTGFCKKHLTMLHDSGENRHGLGLLAKTHLHELLNQIKIKIPGSLLNGNKAKKNDIRTFCTYLKKKENSCMICDRLAQTLKRYTFTIVYLWQKDREFASAFKKSRGVCLHHAVPLMEMAEEALSPKESAQFTAILWESVLRELEALEDEVYQYTQHYDYRFTDKPWGKEKDALQRAIQILSGAYYENP